MAAPTSKEIGRRIKAYRDHNGWSQAEFASRLSGSLNKQSTVSDIERGQRGLQVSEIFEIADVLGVHVYHHLLVTDEAPYLALESGIQIDHWETTLLNQFRRLPSVNARVHLVSFLMSVVSDTLGEDSQEP